MYGLIIENRYKYGIIMIESIANIGFIHSVQGGMFMKRRVSLVILTGCLACGIALSMSLSAAGTDVGRMEAYRRSISQRYNLNAVEMEELDWSKGYIEVINDSSPNSEARQKELEKKQKALEESKDIVTPQAADDAEDDAESMGSDGSDLKYIYSADDPKIKKVMEEIASEAAAATEPPTTLSPELEAKKKKLEAKMAEQPYQDEHMFETSEEYYYRTMTTTKCALAIVNEKLGTNHKIPGIYTTHEEDTIKDCIKVYKQGGLRDDEKYFLKRYILDGAFAIPDDQPELVDVLEINLDGVETSAE